ncbi:MAG: hypothetical protein Pars2KO_00640 [Parasphingorhabdus sp.]
MNHTSKEILDLVQKLEGVLSLLDEGGYSLPAIKIEEAILALKQQERKTTNTGDDS